MPDYCTCGAQLPPDAVFCHKCGKPQGSVAEPEMAVPETAEPLQPAQPVEAKPEFLPLNFHNPAAVRVALIMAAIATLLCSLPFQNAFVWLFLWGAAGFFAVVLYRRRTGYRFTLRAGVFMGWITGVLIFAITTVVFTLSVLPSAMSGTLSAQLQTQLQTQFKNLPAGDPKIQEFLQYLQTGSGIALIVFLSLTMIFVMSTLLSMVGGALGAKLTRRQAG